MSPGRLADLYPLQWTAVLHQGSAAGGSVGKKVSPRSGDHLPGAAHRGKIGFESIRTNEK